MEYKKLMELDDDMYRIGCNCMDENCDLTLFLEPIDETLTLHELCMCGKIHSYYKGNNLLKDIWWRIKTALTILFKGYIEMDGGIILDKENTESLIYVLNKFKKRMEGEN